MSSLSAIPSSPAVQSQRMRALIVVNLVGFINFLDNDFSLLKQMGYDYEIAANGFLRDGSEQVELSILADRGIRFHQIDFDTKNPFSKVNLSAYRQLRSLIRSRKYDVIFCHTPIVGYLTRFAAIRERRLYGAKVIYISHGLTFHKMSSILSWAIYYPIEFIMSYFSDAIITINSEDYSNALHMLCKHVYQLPGVGVDISRMSVGVDFDRDGYRLQLGVEKNDLMVLSVGELSARKNHRVIIEALGLIPNRSNYIYIVCGRDLTALGMKDKLQSRASELGVRVSFLGFREDIPEINNCADIAALPSLREGLGLAGIEALAAGIPVVGADVQGIRDYVAPGKTGYLCNPRSPEQFASAIMSLSRLNQKQKAQMRQECHNMAANFSIEKSRKKLAGIYSDILQKAIKNGN